MSLFLRGLRVAIHGLSPAKNGLPNACFHFTVTHRLLKEYTLATLGILLLDSVKAMLVVINFAVIGVIYLATRILLHAVRFSMYHGLHNRVRLRTLSFWSALLAWSDRLLV